MNLQKRMLNYWKNCLKMRRFKSKKVKKN